jgi:hypothetical protein
MFSRFDWLQFLALLLLLATLFILLIVGNPFA